MYKYCLFENVYRVKCKFVMGDEVVSIYDVKVDRKIYYFNKDIMWRKDQILFKYIVFVYLGKCKDFRISFFWKVIVCFNIKIQYKEVIKENKGMNIVKI